MKIVSYNKLFLALIKEKCLSRTAYRLNRLPIDRSEFEVNKCTEAEALALSSKIYRIQRQNELNLAPRVDKNCFYNTIKCMNKKIKSFGPIAAFIRLKVKSDLVSSIIDVLLFRYLSCIVVDKNMKDNVELFGIIMSSLGAGQNWIKEYFTPEDDQSSQVLKEGPEAVVYASEADMVAAVDAKAAAAANGLKRGAEAVSEEDDAEPRSKKARTSNIVAEKEEETIYSYSKPTPMNPNFPTLLELLDIDNLVLKRWLITKFGIDKLLVIPRLDQILLQQSKSFESLNIPEDFEVIGRDCDGLVSKMKPSADVKISDLATVIFLDNIKPPRDVVETEEVMFWGGADVRNRWTTFADQLSQPEPLNMVRKQLRKKNSGLPSVYINVQADQLPEGLPGLQAMLAANGVSLQ